MNFVILSYPGFFSRYALDIVTTYPAWTVAMVATNIALLLLPLDLTVANYHNEE